MQSAVNHQLGRADFEDLVHKGREHVAGSVALRSGRNRRALVRAESSVPHLPGDAGAGTCAHGARAHGSAELVGADHSGPARGAFLGIKNILSNRFETDDDGLLTGKVLKPILWGPGKASAVEKFASEYGIDLSNS